MINFGVWQLLDTPFGNAPGGRVPPESGRTSPKSRHICHSFYLYKTVSAVFDLKPTSTRIWFRGRVDDIEQKRSDDAKAAKHRRTHNVAAIPRAEFSLTSWSAAVLRRFSAAA